MTRPGNSPKPDQHHKSTFNYARLFAPGLPILTIFTLIVGRAAAERHGPLVLFGLVLATTVVCWFAFIVHIACGCIVRRVTARIDRASKKICTEIRLNRLTYLQSPPASGPGRIRSVN